MNSGNLSQQEVQPLDFIPEFVKTFMPADWTTANVQNPRTRVSAGLIYCPHNLPGAQWKSAEYVAQNIKEQQVRMNRTRNRLIELSKKNAEQTSAYHDLLLADSNNLITLRETQLALEDSKQKTENYKAMFEYFAGEANGENHTSAMDGLIRELRQKDQRIAQLMVEMERDKVDYVHKLQIYKEDCDEVKERFARYRNKNSFKRCFKLKKQLIQANKQIDELAELNLAQEMKIAEFPTCIICSSSMPVIRYPWCAHLCYCQACYDVAKHSHDYQTRQSVERCPLCRADAGPKAVKFA